MFSVTARCERYPTLPTQIFKKNLAYFYLKSKKNMHQSSKPFDRIPRWRLDKNWTNQGSAASSKSLHRAVFLNLPDGLLWELLASGFSGILFLLMKWKLLSSSFEKALFFFAGECDLSLYHKESRLIFLWKIKSLSLFAEQFSIQERSIQSWHHFQARFQILNDPFLPVFFEQVFSA